MQHTVNPHWARKVFSFIGLLTLAFSRYSSASVGPASAQEMGAASVVVALSTADGKDAFAPGEPVVVHVTITNPGTRAISILKAETPLEGVGGPLFEVLLDGAAVPYLGQSFNQAAPTEQDFIAIEAGQSLETDVELSAYYDLAVTGQYTVRYAFASLDLYALGSAERQPQTAVVTSNSLSLFVEGSNLPGEKRPAAGDYALALDSEQNERALAESSPALEGRVLTTELIDDPSFEAWNSVDWDIYWYEYSTNFGTPICTPTDCSGDYSRDGTRWAWFGGISNAYEEGEVSQFVYIPEGTAFLKFYVWRAFVAPTADSTDYVRVQIDDNTIWTLTAIQAFGAGYQPVLLDVSAYADGASHWVEWSSVTQNRPDVATGFMVDDVSLIVSHPHTNFDADAKTDPAKYVGGAVWYLKSTSGTWEGKYVGSDGTYVRRSDFDGDGRTDPAKFVAGTFWWLKSSTGIWEGKYVGEDGGFWIGSDFDGDNKDDPAKRVDGVIWYLSSITGIWGFKVVGTDGDAYWTGNDFDGDGITDPSKTVGGNVWYLQSSTSTWGAKYIGTDGDYLPRSDFDGDGKTDPAKDVAGTIWWLKSSTGTWDARFVGADGFIIPGADFDGDGKTDPAKLVSGTVWYMQSGSAYAWAAKYIGMDGVQVID